MSNPTPSKQVTFRRLSRALVQAGFSHDAAAGYIIAARAWGPWKEKLPDWPAAAFVEQLPAFSADLKTALDVARELVDSVELDHVIGRESR